MNNETETSPAAAVSAIETSEPVSRHEMTVEDYQQWEREVQLGIRTTMPNGEKITEFRENLIKRQLEQEKALREVGAKTNSTTGVSGEIAPETLVEVTVHANGAVSATPVVEKVEPEKIAHEDDGEKEPENDLPENFPHRDKLLAAGFVSLEIVAKMTLEDLKGVDGIGFKSAQTILDYGKSA